MSSNYQSISSNYQSIDSEENVKSVSTNHEYGVKISHIQATLLSILFFILLALVGYMSYHLSSGNGCLGPPYLYISHHDSHNLLKYTRDGCPLSPNVLWFGGSVQNAPGSIRSMVIHPYEGIKDALFVANAGDYDGDNGRVLVFDTCADLNGMRSYIKTLVDLSTTSGAQHTYSLTFDNHNNLYASFQHTDAVLKFENSTYTSLPSIHPYWYNDLDSKGKDDDESDDNTLNSKKKDKESSASISRNKKNYDTITDDNMAIDDSTSNSKNDDSSRYIIPEHGRRNYTFNSRPYNGTFVQFGYPGTHDIATQGIRAIAW
eukprot:CAMPEP_0119055648 /NCGR_PEP_ID=MMETSP1177-20130426/75842_1 /TAXON_ID=2985 /ORGANISM="Ochromonas sp, Strain CCMP1899" /LENGTH=316 /DNA_ID=CAMNT_0007036223 /DNA_START=195 /DNA_END=1142 /DNA_ORIENTATION=+